MAGDATLEITRLLEASPVRVFDAWMEREQFEAWIGPEGVKCQVPVHEPRVGGRYKILMGLSTGQIMPIMGVFKTIERPTRIAFTWALEGSDHDSLVTLTFREKGGKTELTLYHEGLLTIDNRDAHGRGWNSALDKLEAFLK